MGLDLSGSDALRPPAVARRRRAARLERLSKIGKGRRAGILFYRPPQLEPRLQWWRGSPGAGTRRRERVSGPRVEDCRTRDGSFLESSGGRWWLGRRDWLLAIRFPLCVYRRRSPR